MGKLNICMVQTQLHWEDKSANIQMLTKKLQDVNSNTDLVILPEMFTTGFSMKPELYSESMEGSTVNWMRNMADQLNCVITGTLIIEESGNFFNRLVWMRPDGSYSFYDKRHLFSLAGEENHYSAGKNRLVVDIKGFKIMPLICYDLRFPVWCRNDLDYDLAIFVANWPEKRSFFWSQLLVARAIENQSFVVGLNRVGFDGNQISHSGNSICLGPLGNSIKEIDSGKEELAFVQITKAELKSVRDQFKFLNDKDDFNITI
ncbi:MAG: amidohydrolase [Salibacteraceae bacterium]